MISEHFMMSHTLGENQSCYKKGEIKKQWRESTHCFWYSTYHYPISDICDVSVINLSQHLWIWHNITSNIFLFTNLSWETSVHRTENEIINGWELHDEIAKPCVVKAWSAIIYKRRVVLFCSTKEHKGKMENTRVWQEVEDSLY